MLSNLEHFYLNQPEPTRGCLLAIKTIIHNLHENISTAWKYNMPFFYYKGERFCYLWVQKKTGLPYIGFTHGQQLFDPELLSEKRTRMKIFMIDPQKDLPVDKIVKLLNEAIILCKQRS